MNFSNVEDETLKKDVMEISSKHKTSRGGRLTIKTTYHTIELKKENALSVNGPTAPDNDLERCFVKM